jgi:hypothetical protein
MQSAGRPAASAECSFARSLSFIGPAENPASLHLRLRWRCGDFSLRRRRRGRQIIALHRIDQFAIRGLADRRTGIGSRGRVLGHQLHLRPCRGCHQQSDKYQLFHGLPQARNVPVGHCERKLAGVHPPLEGPGGGEEGHRFFNVIARSDSDEAIHTCFAAMWIASRSLSSGAHSRDPLARNDVERYDSAFPRRDASGFCQKILASDKRGRREYRALDAPAALRAK